MRGITKKALRALLVLGLVLTVGACGKSEKVETPNTDNTPTEAPATGGTSTDSSNDKVELRFSWWGGDSRHNATLDALKAFEAKYPNITVKAEYGAWSGWQENIATQLAGKQEADVLQINWNWISQFSANGDKFYDLNKLDTVSKANYPADLLELMSVNGSLQGLPVGTTGRVFYWNETTFAEAGLAVPTTFAEIIAAGEVFKTKLGDDHYPLALGEWDRMLMMVYYLQQVYGLEWATDGKVNYTTEQVQEGLDFITMLEDKHVIPTLSTLSGDGATSLDKNPKWMDGNYAGIYEWDSSASKFQSALSEGQNFVIGQFPTDLGTNKSGFTKISLGLAISANTKHPEEAALLLEFLTTDPEGVKILGLERGTVSNSAAEATLVEAGLLTGLTYDANNAVMEFKGFDVDPNFEHSSLKDSTGYYYEVFQNLSYKQSTSADLAQYLIDSVNEVYAAN